MATAGEKSICAWGRSRRTRLLKTHHLLVRHDLLIKKKKKKKKEQLLVKLRMSDEVDESTSVKS